MAPQLLTLWTHLNKIFLIHTTQQQSPVTNQNKNLKKNSRDDQNKLQAQKKIILLVFTKSFCWCTGKLLALMLNMLFPEKHSMSSQCEFHATLLAFGS